MFVAIFLQNLVKNSLVFEHFLQKPLEKNVRHLCVILAEKQEGLRYNFLN